MSLPFYPLVFANLDPGAAPLAPGLRGLEDVIRPYALADLQVVGQRELSQPWNWKVMAENFAEGYHHSTQHAKSIPAFPTKTSVCLELDDGPYSIYDNHGRPESSGQRLLGIGIFPHALFAVSENRGRRSVVWLHLRQLGPVEHQLVISALADEPFAASPERSERFMEGVLTFHREDQELCRETRRGLASAYAGMPNLPRSHERVIERFQAWICGEFTKAA